jgi:hypothetical protein
MARARSWIDATSMHFAANAEVALAFFLEHAEYDPTAWIIDILFIQGPA